MATGKGRQLAQCALSIQISLAGEHTNFIFTANSFLEKRSNFKIHIFWEGHKNLSFSKSKQINWENSSYFYGFLRIYELWVAPI